MELKSSYILIPNPFVEKEKGFNGHKEHLSKGFKHYVKEVLSINETSQWKVDRLRSVIVDRTIFDMSPSEVKVVIYEVEKTNYVEISINGKTKKKIIEQLEILQRKLLNDEKGLNSKYVIIVSYDSISEYYCNKVYSKLNMLERNMRHLLYLVYVVNFGKDYYKSTIPNSLQNSAKSNIMAKGNKEEKEIKRLKEFFYAFVFSDYSDLLFTKQITQIEIKEKDKFLSVNTDLSKLSDNDLREAFKAFNPRSDWERFFSNKISNIDIEELLKVVHNSRNIIAHSKFLNNQQYLECNRAINRLNVAIKSAIEIAKKEDFKQKNQEYLNSLLENIFSSMTLVGHQLKSIVIPITELSVKVVHGLSPTAKLLNDISLKGVESVLKICDFETEYQNRLSKLNKKNDKNEESEEHDDELFK